MIVGLAAAVLTALCYGIASALQATAVRGEADTGGVDARLLVRLARHGPFVAGVVLDVLAFFTELVALRYLAVFVVQAVQAGNLAVTAVAAIPLLGARLAGREWAAIGAVCLGLVVLAVAAGEERPASAGSAVRWSFLGAALAVTALGVLVGRMHRGYAPIALGFVAGLGFGIVALAARVLIDLHPLRLLADPALYALAIAGVTSFLFYATALQRRSVTMVTAAVIIAETVVPAVVGVAVLGDATRPGFAPVAVAGFAVAVAGAVMLARFGEPVAEPSPALPPAAGPSAAAPSEAAG